MSEIKLRSVWYNLSWERLSAIGNVSVLKFSYLSVATIPVMASAVEWLNGIPVLEAWHLTPVHLSWPLALFFFGSVVLALATLLQEIGCPSLIKSFRSATDYRRSALQERELDDLIEKRLRNLDQTALMPQLTTLADQLQCELPPSFLPQLANSVERTIESALLEAKGNRNDELANASQEWHTENERSPKLRAVVTWLYYISAGIAIISLICVPSARVLNAVFFQ